MAHQQTLKYRRILFFSRRHGQKNFLKRAGTAALLAEFVAGANGGKISI
jgi:hypothetical protein